MTYNQFETGKRIQKLRKTKQMTQEQFAVELNISDRHMRSLEKGEYTPSLDLFVEIAAYFDVTLDFLIRGITASPREKKLNQYLIHIQQVILQVIKALSTIIDELETQSLTDPIQEPLWEVFACLQRLF